MTEDEKSLVVATQAAKRLVELVYQDLAQPVAKRLGYVLGGILDLVSLPFSAITNPASKATILLKKNLEDFGRRLQAIPSESFRPPPSEVAVPILDRFRYLSTEEIRRMFVELLARACDSSSDPPAHPGFIRIIDSLSVDEARIVQHFSTSPVVPYLYLRMVFEEEKRWNAVNRLIISDIAAKALAQPGIDRPEELTNLSMEIHMDHPDKVAFYLNNLASLGVIEKTGKRLSDFKKWYSPIQTQYESERLRFYAEGHKGKKYPVEFIPGYYSTTRYGHMFIETVCSRGLESK